MIESDGIKIGYTQATFFLNAFNLSSCGPR